MRKTKIRRVELEYGDLEEKILTMVEFQMDQAGKSNSQ